MRHLQIGDSKTVSVNSRLHDNWTGLCLHRDETYMFSVVCDDIWYDAFVKTGSTGWYIGPMNKVYELMSRLPSEKISVLTGMVHEDIFFIGKRNTIKVRETGELSLFANDVRGFYWNNYGSLRE